MIFENYKEYNQLISEVTSILRSVRGLKKETEEIENDTGDDDPIGGEVPLDEVLPPSKGHETGARVPNTSSKNQPYYGGPFIEGRLEDRLYKRLLTELGAGDQTSSSQQATQQGQVGIVPAIGHSGKGTTPGDARRREVDTMSKVKAADAEARIDKTKPDETDDEPDEVDDAIKSLGLDSDEAAAATPI